MSYPSDEEIVKGCTLNKRDAQLALFNIYGSRLFGVCNRYLPSKQDAEDAFQDGFVKIFTGIKSFEPKSNHSLYAWMKKIMSNTCLNFLRDTRKYRLMFELNVNYEPVNEENNEISLSGMLDDITSDEIMEIIQSLPDGYRTIFNLYALDGLSHAEISDVLHISVSTSKTQLMKARRAIASKITQKASENIKKHSFNLMAK
jgi:RNA polymerase sigma factor (sigma-70 family)